MNETPREIALKIVRGLDAARRASSFENPVDEVGLIEAAIADALDRAATESNRKTEGEA